MPLKKIVLFIAINCILISQTHAAGCKLHHVPVEPLTPGHYEVFQAKANSVELNFKSDANDPEVDAFPDPPLTVKQFASNTQCEINSGIWVRKDIYFSQDEKVLVTHEYSGSNDFLMFYKTADCSKLHELDVSMSRWKITGSTISVQNMEDQKKVRKPIQYALDASCKPVSKK